MVDNEMLRKEMNKNWVLLLVTNLAIGLVIPVQIWIQYLDFQNYQKSHMTSLFTINFDNFGPSFIFMLFVFTLAIIQIGIERNNGTLEFTLGMPFSRASIFLSKWMIGFGSILVSWLVSYGITGLINRFVNISTVNFDNYYWYLLGGMLLVYTMTLAIGSLTGSAFAQGLVTLSVSILPMLIFGLFTVQLEVFTDIHLRFNDQILWGTYNITPLAYLFFKFASFPIKEVYPPFIEATVFLMIGYYAFIKQPFERNGSFFMWKWMEKPIQVMVILIGFLGCSAFGYLTSLEHSMIGYFVGAVLGVILGFIISYFVIYKKKNR